MRTHGFIRLATLSILSILGLLTFPPIAAADLGEARHPGPGAITPPAGVPSAYVFTHSGWFHPSCVVRVREDEAVGADRVVRGRADGAAHFSLSPCAYTRFDLGGHAMAAGGAAHLPPQAAGAIYDGYIVYYTAGGSITPGSTLVTDEIVPPAPTDVVDQDIAFFNDITTTAGGEDILQPVLDFNGETRGKWSIESEHCCIDNNDMQTTPVVVLPGDTIRGTVVGTGCASSGVCSAWSVTTADVTTGKSTTLNTTAPSGVPNGVSPGSLETYGVTACDMFPAGGETTFTGNSLTDSQGNTQTLKYRLITFQQVDAEVPTNCGYGGRTSGNDFTLIYGAVPAGTDGGVSTGGTSGAKGTGGAGGHTGTGGAGTGGALGTGGATVTGTGGSASTGGSSGTGGSPGGADNTGGTTRGSAGATGAGDAGDSSGGCSCDTSGNPAPGFSLLFAFVAASLWSRSRRRS